MREMWCADFYMCVPTIEKTAEPFQENLGKESLELTKMCYCRPRNNFYEHF